MTRQLRSWAPLAPLGALAAGLGLLLRQPGLPSSYLFAALLVGLAVALAWPGRVGVPPAAFAAAQAVTGVALGAAVRSSSLTSLAHSWLPVILVSAGTLAISLAAGRVLARVTFVDERTGALGMIAGGASGIVAMADELGADGRLVAFMQYLRVLIVVLITPLLLALLFPGHPGASAPGVTVLGDGRGWLLTLGVAAGGAAVASRVRLPAGMLLIPMVAAAVVALLVPDADFNVPDLLQQGAFALIGLQVGLRFTAETVRSLGSLLLPVLAAIAVLIVLSFGLAVVLELTTTVSLSDAYLATTPGGIFAVVAVAFGAGANTTFIVAVQGLRVLVMVLLAPLAVRRLARGARV